MKVHLEINKENFAVCIMVIDVKSETSTSYGNSSKTQMPEIILCNHFQSTVSNQQFRLKMERFEYDTARLNLQDRISQYRSLFERSLEDHTRSNEADLKKQFERKLIDLIRNSCAACFLKDHARQIAGLETVEGVFEYIENVFGVETDEMIKERAEDQLRKVTRRADLNEKYDSFLKRIQIIVKDIDTKVEVQNFLAEDVFRKNIEPMNLTFLKDSKMHRKTAQEISTFLDERERYACAQVSLLETDKMNYFIDQATQNIGDKLTGLSVQNNKEINEKHTKIEQKVDNFAAVVEQLTATIARLESEKRQNFNPRSQPFHQSVPRFQAPGQQVQHQSNFQPQNNFQQSQRFSNPQNPNCPFCNLCNSFGHIKRNCRLIVCHNCRESGHVARFCRNPGLNNNQRNTQNNSQSNPGN